MQNTASSPNLSSMSTGIVPPPLLYQQAQFMQSTTPSVANGKGDMRGWLYKWTNVEKLTFHFLLINIIYIYINISFFF